jgi:hypothetical protein
MYEREVIKWDQAHCPSNIPFVANSPRWTAPLHHGERPGRGKRAGINPVERAVATMMTGVGEGAVGVASANELSASTGRPNFLCMQKHE